MALNNSNMAGYNSHNMIGGIPKMRKLNQLERDQLNQKVNMDLLNNYDSEGIKALLLGSSNVDDFYDLSRENFENQALITSNQLVPFISVRLIEDYVVANPKVNLQDSRGIKPVFQKVHNRSYEKKETGVDCTLREIYEAGLAKKSICTPAEIIEMNSKKCKEKTEAMIKRVFVESRFRELSRRALASRNLGNPKNYANFNVAPKRNIRKSKTSAATLTTKDLVASLAPKQELAIDLLSKTAQKNWIENKVNDQPGTETEAKPKRSGHQLIW